MKVKSYSKSQCDCITFLKNFLKMVCRRKKKVISNILQLLLRDTLVSVFYTKFLRPQTTTPDT